MGHYSCNQCGWIHFEVTLEYAKEQIEAFNKYYDNLPAEKQIEYYGGRKSSMATYDRCDSCGNSGTNFVLATDAQLEAIRGSTIGPIVVRQ